MQIFMSENLLNFFRRKNKRKVAHAEKCQKDTQIFFFSLVVIADCSALFTEQLL